MSKNPTPRKPGRALKRRAGMAIGRIRDGIQTVGAKPHPSPIIILGLQKSGTTAIAALLAAVSGRPASLDLKNEMKTPLTDRLKSGAISMEEFVAVNKLDFSREIIKEPSLSPFYHELRAYFPRARFVMVIRDPRDNIRSILNRLKLRGDLAKLAEEEHQPISRAWELILDGAWLGLAGGNYVEKLAYRWNHITDIYLQHKGDIALARYETFLEDKVAEIRRLAASLGLPHEHDIRDMVDIQFQPAGDRSVRWLDFYGAGNLSRIERICEDRMRQLDYARSG